MKDFEFSVRKLLVVRLPACGMTFRHDTFVEIKHKLVQPIATLAF
jgi:hypothetical protein